MKIIIILKKTNIITTEAFIKGRQCKEAKTFVFQLKDVQQHPEASPDEQQRNRKPPHAADY